MSDSDSDFQVDNVAEGVEGKRKKWGKTYLVPIHKLLTCQVNLKLDTMFHEFFQYFCAKNSIVYTSNMDTLLKLQWNQLQQSTKNRFFFQGIIFKLIHLRTAC
jgi:hypothetical protein